MSYYDGTGLLDSLNARTVEKLEVNADESCLLFTLADGTQVFWDTEGDCCSRSWWADATELNSLRGAVVQKVESVEMPDADEDTGGDLIQVYGFRITTDQGVTNISFRNASNGYYGGWAFLAPDGAWSDAGEWREITGNEWSA